MSKRKIEKWQIFKNLWAGYECFFVAQYLGPNLIEGYRVHNANKRWEIQKAEFYRQDLEYDAEHFPVVGKCNLNAILKVAIMRELGICERGMTNLEHIKSMGVDALAEFLDEIAYGNAPWSELFANAFCKSCPTETVKAEGYKEPLELCECDFVDGKCPHGDSLRWWLKQEREAEANEA